MRALTDTTPLPSTCPVHSHRYHVGVYGNKGASTKNKTVTFYISVTKAKKINTEHRLSVTERILQTSGFARDAAGLKALTNTAKGLLWKRRQARLQTRDFVAQNAAAAKSTKRVQRSRRNKPLSGHTRVRHPRNPAARFAHSHDLHVQSMHRSASAPLARDRGSRVDSQLRTRPSTSKKLTRQPSVRFVEDTRTEARSYSGAGYEHPGSVLAEMGEHPFLSPSIAAKMEQHLLEEGSTPHGIPPRHTRQRCVRLAS